MRYTRGVFILLRNVYEIRPWVETQVRIYYLGRPMFFSGSREQIFYCVIGAGDSGGHRPFLRYSNGR